MWSLCILLVLTSRFSFGNCWKEPFDVDLVKEKIEVSITTPRHLPSDAWRPTIFTTCLAGFHNDSAPCRRIPNLSYAEELIYPDFRLRLPRFVDPKHKNYFLTIMHTYRHAWLRGRIIGNYGYFLNQRGQNLLYENVTFSGQPTPGRWGDDACVGSGSHHHVHSFAPWSGSAEAPAVIYAASPDDESFQHFSDRVAMILAQVRHIGRPSDWKYIGAGSGFDSDINQLWAMLVPGLNPEDHLLSGFIRGLRARLFLYPCQTPLIHPYTHQLTSELYQQAAGVDPARVVPMSKRPLVLFMERPGPRPWANEAECRQEIAHLLAIRGKGEQLMVFNATQFSSYSRVVELGRQVKLMVGAHGGAFFNVIFMQPGTAVVEICPIARDHSQSRCRAMIWELAGVRRMPYWSVLADQTTPRFAITHLDCGLVTAAVKEALEEVDLKGAHGVNPLEAFHQGTIFN